MLIRMKLINVYAESSNWRSLQERPHKRDFASPLLIKYYAKNSPNIHFADNI